MKVAIVDDELDMRQSISQWLVLSGYETETFASARDALKVVGPGYPGVVLSDIRMPEIDGMTFLKRLMHHDSALPVVLITGHGDVPMAVEAMRVGAFDFLEKPFDPEQMTDIVQRACSARKLALENRALRNELASGDAAATRLIGDSPAMVRLREDILDLAQADAPVLIDGETGTGKTLVARALHAVGARATRPLVQVFCGEHDEAGQIARIFGGGEGGETATPALVEARNGVLMLEDVQALAPAAQARLVSWLDEGPVSGSPRIISICGSQAPAGQAAEDLRADLYHRLSALHLSLPPLRERGDDILLLFGEFTQNFSEEYGAPAPHVSPQEAAQLLQAPWPGNVRQLMNVAERAVLQSRRGGGSITSLLISDNDAVALPVTQVTQEGKPLKEYVEAFERMLIDNTMRRHQGSVAKVMEELCLPRRTLNEKMAKYGLVRSDYT
ncbi:DNA-binding response regulator [Meridianimarinicoccus roseus]|uniref:DNA-binding response regulator n=1 Tax=Meridianimarinicoccus roseus TaxID=2072018 RepID=A0A2V2LKV8_9RHOB|nr:sigma-54 dependent transcriptional regulator [Meridianimarinicoccus roseus]PWR02949.1 DNA-binding response regulator [Meridianimarinicoccus roseus]